VDVLVSRSGDIQVVERKWTNPDSDRQGVGERLRVVGIAVDRQATTERAIEEGRADSAKGNGRKRNPGGGRRSVMQPRFIVT
jgi:hypothetical protein